MIKVDKSKLKHEKPMYMYTT